MSRFDSKDPASRMNASVSTAKPSFSGNMAPSMSTRITARSAVGPLGKVTPNAS